MNNPHRANTDDFEPRRAWGTLAEMLLEVETVHEREKEPSRLDELEERLKEVESILKK